MGYTVATIISIINSINQNIFIPEIQRPYVWKYHQIELLFDSLMRGYPIGSLMLWTLPEGCRNLMDVYSFSKDFHRNDTHTNTVDIEKIESVLLVLDGQQRLTSLLIGLKGSYSFRAADPMKKLYIDLLHSPSNDAVDDDDDDESSPIDQHYKFKFFDNTIRPRNKIGEFWFEVGRIIDTQGNNEELALINYYHEIDRAFNTDRISLNIAKANLRRLWESIWLDNSICYFNEKSDSYDRVLDIFIRANSAGSVLRRSDLLMSVIALRWDILRPQGEIQKLVEYITQKLTPKRTINSEFILKTALFLNDLDFAFRVKSFVPSNIRQLEENWQRVREVIEFTTDFFRKNFLYGERLSGINILMLVAYYIHKKNLNNNNLILSDIDQQKIRQWVIIVIFKGVLATQTTNTLSSYRRTINENINSENFPTPALIDLFDLLKRPIRFTGHDFNKWFATHGSDIHAESLLSLLYPASLAQLKRTRLPLIKETNLTDEELTRAGVDENDFNIIRSNRNKLILYVALDTQEQVNYYALPFELWVQTLQDEFFQIHSLPDNRHLYSLEKIPELVIARKELLLIKLSRILN